MNKIKKFSKTCSEIFSNKKIMKKILFTLWILAIYRLFVFIPVPFADISVKHWFDVIALTTYSGYLNIAEMCKCSSEFLEKIKNHIKYVKNYSSLFKYWFYFQRVKFSFAMEINKRMKEFHSVKKC